MLHHAHAHDAVEFVAQLVQVAVVHALYAQQVGQTFLFNALIERVLLLVA